jgi:hypothetical protein
MLFNVMCQQTDKKALAQNFSLIFVKEIKDKNLRMPQSQSQRNKNKRK